MNVEDLPEETIIFSNPDYKNALIGVSHDNRAVYDYDKMVACLMTEDGMTEEEAEEFIDYNTIGVLGIKDSPIVVYLG